MAIKYNLVSSGFDSNITVFVNGEMYVASNLSHENFEDIVAAALAEDESIVDMFDHQKVVTKRFEKVSDRVSVANGTVFFDGDPVDSTLTRQILRFVEEDSDFMPLVNFFEKVQQNPNEHSREQLYRWLNDRDFSIAPDGDFLAYKGVQSGENGVWVSVHSGTAIVDGEIVTGNIPNPIGSVIEMPRSEVQHDPSVACHTGLHAGTWDYASGFARTVLLVKINPRDVVSVPTDARDQKLRVCRYTVVEKVTSPYSEALVDLAADDDVEYDDDEPNCLDCNDEGCYYCED